MEPENKDFRKWDCHVKIYTVVVLCGLFVSRENIFERSFESIPKASGLQFIIILLLGVQFSVFILRLKNHHDSHFPSANVGDVEVGIYLESGGNMISAEL